jgi:hypothetical protein
MGWREVTQDQFQGSLRYPLFNMHRQQGMPHQAPAYGEFPAGLRTVWTGKGFEWEAVAIETPEGRRFWLSDKIEVLTVDEASARWNQSLAAATIKILEENHARELAAANAAGLTVEAWKDRRKLKAMRKLFAKHRRSTEQFQRDMLAAHASGLYGNSAAQTQLSNKDA